MLLMHDFRNVGNCVNELDMCVTYSHFSVCYRATRSISYIICLCVCGRVCACVCICISWWHHGMETLSCIIRALCEGNLPTIGRFLLPRVSNVGLWCLVWCWVEQAFGQTFEWPVIWDAMTLIYTLCLYTYEALADENSTGVVIT